MFRQPFHRTVRAMAGPPIIIIADTDALIRDVLRVEFSHLGFIVLLAATGPEAEDIAMRTIADLAILDLALPGYSGYDACFRIRRQSRYKDTPIVLTARKRSSRVEAAAQKAGATMVLGKPYSFNDLLTTLAPHLPPNHPLLTRLPRAAGLGEGTTHEWGRQDPLEWRFGADSGLSRNGRVLRVVRGGSVRIPLVRKP